MANKIMYVLNDRPCKGYFNMVSDKLRMMNNSKIKIIFIIIVLATLPIVLFQYAIYYLTLPFAILNIIARDL